MRKFILPFILILLVTVVSAQDATQTDIKKKAQTDVRKGDTSARTDKWKLGGTASLNFGQGGSRNWAAGAEKYSISLAAYVSLYASRRIGKWYWDNSLDLGYAFVNTSSQGVRKNDDKIDFYTKLGRDISDQLSISAVVNFRSQMTDGFDYNYLGKGLKRRISDFFAPAYLTIAPGIDWHPLSYFSVFFSPISPRMVIVTNQPKSYYYPGGVIPAADGGGFELPLSALYGVDPAREVRSEFGGFLSANFKKDIFKNVSYKSRLDLFSNYLKSYRFEATGPDELLITETKPKPQNVDIYWTNTIILKVNKWLEVTYNFDIIYDDDVRQFGDDKKSAATQMRSLLAVGVAAKF